MSGVWLFDEMLVEILSLNNPGFKGVEFDTFKNDAGRNAFTMTPTKWIRAERAKKLNVTARQQMQTLAQQPTPKKLESKPKP